MQDIQLQSMYIWKIYGSNLEIWPHWCVFNWKWFCLPI